jgi:predicted ABC-type sugar transport system permease subunit
MTLFIGSGLTYFGLFAWIVRAKLRGTIPYVVVAGVSVILVTTYIASRTVGVPIVGVEYYVGKLDMVSKVLQVIIIGLSLYLASSIRRITVNIHMRK